jgi:hypothetical protein
MGSGQVCLAQSAQGTVAGSLAGKLTDLHSNPLAGVAVVLRNESTGAETRTTTAKNGAYRFGGLEPGDYALEAESPALGRGHVEQIFVAGGHEAHVQTALDFDPLLPSPVLVALHKPEPPKTQVQIKPPQPVTPLIAQPALKAEPPRIVARVAPAVALTAKAAPALAIHPPASNRGAAMAAAATQAALATAMQIAQTVRRPLMAASQTSGPAGPNTIAAAELQALPVTGRHWQVFLLDNAPTSATQAGGHADISQRGASQQRAGVTVDGASHALAFGTTNATGQGSQGQGALGQGNDEPAGIAQVGAGGHGFAVNETAVRTVETAAGNAEAEAGRMNVETQHGGDRLHGQGFLFDRQKIWGAKNPSTQWVQNTGMVTNPVFTSIANPVFSSVPYTPQDREISWGIGAGSRIRHSKLSWFAALDNSERNHPGLATAKHPFLCADTLCTTQTGFFAQPSNDQMQVLAARLGLSAANAPAEGLAAYWPMLESDNLGGLLGPSPRASTQWTGFGRIDWHAAERHRFAIEGTVAHWNSTGGGLTRVSEAYGNHSFGSTKADEQWLLGRWEAFLTSNLLAVTQVSARHEIHSARPSTPSDFEKTFLAGNAWGQLPQIVVDNRYGFTIGTPSRFGTGSYPDERLYQTQESLDWIHGKLLIRAGFDLRHSFDATTLLRNQTGTYTYSNVENFVSDALVFQRFGLSSELDPFNQRNCDQTGKVWRDSENNLRGIGSLPCFSYYSQTMGPADWHLSTNDLAGYATAQWQPAKLVLLSAGLRWEREQLPPPLANLNNPELPLTSKLPSLGNNWGPRAGLTVGSGESRWPLLRLGYGIYFGRTENSTVETALTQTGSLNGDLNLFIRPLDGFNPPTGTSNAPPFPYVLQGNPASVIKPGAVEFAPVFHNPEIHQGIASVEEKLPGHIELTASAMVSLGRRLPISIDTNLASHEALPTITYAVEDATGKGPIKATQITVPFYASWPSSGGTTSRPNSNYQQITQIASRANSTYEAAMLRAVRSGRRGLSLRAQTTYGHAMDWNPNEGSQVAGNDVLDPSDFSLEYGTGNLDMRLSAGATVIYETPWKLHRMAGKFANGWMLSGVGHFRGGMPFTMRTSGSLPKEFLHTTSGTETVVGVGPGMNGSGGDNRVYGIGSDGHSYNIGRNTYRYPATWKADLRLAKRFSLGSSRQLELLAESFNLFNHQNVTQLETTGYTIQSGTASGALPTLNFLTGLKVNTTAFGQPLSVNTTNYYRERQFQFGLRMRF